jgi:hypothetical protein
MVTGVLLFALVGHFVLRPVMARDEQLSPALLRTLVGVALAACALSLVLRRNVPRRPGDESTDFYWTTAAPRAMRMWMPLEGASLLAVYLYARTGAHIPLAVAAVAVSLFVVLNPAFLERQR